MIDKKGAKEAEKKAEEAIENALDFLTKYQEEPYKKPENEFDNDSEKEKMIEISNAGRQAGLGVKDLCNNIQDIFKDKTEREFKHNYNGWQNGTTVKSQFFVEFKDKSHDKINASIALFISNKGESDSPVYLAIEMRDKAGNNLHYRRHNRLLELPIESTDKLYYTIKLESSSEHINPRLSKETIKYIYDHNETINKRKIQKVRLQYDIKIDDNEKYPIMEQIEAGIKLLIPYYDYVVKMEDKDRYQYNKNIILYGPPGTGKTYHTIYYAVGIIENKPYETILSEDYGGVLSRYNRYKNEGKIMFSTFHQSYSYEEFIGGIMPKLKNSSEEQSSDEKKEDNLLYELESGKFKDFCDKARARKGNFVFVIDEINRGNISKIFGELITLIEESKRLGEKEEMKLQLPHFKEEFGVPNNVYIIGTMNTADRSIALIDTALRRRFNFIEMMPNPKILEGVKINKELDICKMLETINKRISVLYDREHTIGHAYFISLIENPSLNQLAKIFRNSIIPLLQEYFYEDYEKIQLVLGDNKKSNADYKFIKDKEVIEKDIFKGQTDIDIVEKEYEINQEAFSNLQSYIEIYSNASESNALESNASESGESK